MSNITSEILLDIDKYFPEPQRTRGNNWIRRLLAERDADYVYMYEIEKQLETANEMLYKHYEEKLDAN